MGIKSVIDFVYSHTDEDFVIIDCDILDEVYEDMKNKKDLRYSVSDIKNVKDDIIIIEDTGSLTEYLKLLQDLFDTIDLPFSQIILLSTESKNSLKDYV